MCVPCLGVLGCPDCGGVFQASGYYFNKKGTIQSYGLRQPGCSHRFNDFCFVEPLLNSSGVCPVSLILHLPPVLILPLLNILSLIYILHWIIFCHTQFILVVQAAHKHMLKKGYKFLGNTCFITQQLMLYNTEIKL